MTRKQLEEFLKNHQSDKLTLDIGCEQSSYAKYFPNRTGLDIKPGLGVDVVGDAHNLPFGNEKFDIILCTEVLEHLHSPSIAISEMNRVLKKNGKLILSTRFIFPLHNTPNDYWRFTKYGLKELFKNWDILELHEEVGTKNVIAVLMQRMGYQADFKGGGLIKAIVFLTAKIIYVFPSLIKKEFGDINHSVKEKNILASGYYMVCKKRQ